MKNTCFKTALILTVLSLVLCFLPACGNEADVPSDSYVTDTEALTESIDFNAKWKVVRPDKADDDETHALQLICRALKSAYGVSFEATTDFLKPEMGLVESEYEILIGSTNRQESQDACADLDGKTGLYRIVSDKRIVIAGGSPDATYAAAVAFAKDILNYEEESDSDTKYTVISRNSSATVSPGLELKLEVPFPTVILNGTDLSEYCLVYSSQVKKADTLASMILGLCGHKPELIAEADYVSGPAIFLGYTPGCDGGHVSEYTDSYSYYITSKPGFVALDWEGKNMESSIYEDFFSKYMPDVTTGTAKADLPEGTTAGFTVQEYNRLQLADESKETVSEGVTYSCRSYKDSEGAPVIVHTLIVEKGAARFYTALPGNAESESYTVGTVMSTIKAAEASGLKVLAGTNGGFFDMAGTHLSRGLTVREGKLVAENNARPFFGVLKNGEVGLYNSTDYDTSKINDENALVNQLQTAVAGSALLLKNGKINNIAAGTDMAVTRHPRTAIGLRQDGTVVLIEIDGRQEKISNGASYLDLVQIFRELDCTDAMNMDGGGSSTFIISRNGTHTLLNSPSDGSMRQVQDCLLIVAK